MAVHVSKGGSPRSQRHFSGSSGESTASELVGVCVLKTLLLVPPTALLPLRKLLPRHGSSRVWKATFALMLCDCLHRMSFRGLVVKRVGFLYVFGTWGMLCFLDLWVPKVHLN